MAALQATHPDQAIKETVSEYYIAQEIDAATDGMLIAIPEQEWTHFTQVSSIELGIILLYIASCVDLKKYKKNPEAPKNHGRRKISSKVTLMYQPPSFSKESSRRW